MDDNWVFECLGVLEVLDMSQGYGKDEGEGKRKRSDPDRTAI